MVAGGGCVTEVLFNSQQAVDYLAWHKSLEDAGYWVDYGRSEYDITWANSKLAMHMTSSAAARGRVEIGEGNGFTVGAGRMPYNQDVDYVGNTVGGGMILLTDGLEPEVEEGALTFLMFLLEPENMANWHKSTGYIPVTQSGFDYLEAEGWFDENPTFAVANHQLAESARAPQTAGAIFGSFAQVYQMYREVFQNILRNDADIQASLDSFEGGGGPANRRIQPAGALRRIVDEASLKRMGRSPHPPTSSCSAALAHGIGHALICVNATCRVVLFAPIG